MDRWQPRVHITGTNPDSDAIGDGGSGFSLPFGAVDFGNIASEIDKLNLFDLKPKKPRSGGVRLAGDLPEQLINRHIVDEHVNRTDTQLIARIRERQFRGLFATVGMYRNGSFDSLEAARDLIRQTLVEDTAAVSKVVSGSSDRGLAIHRFGYVTGREAILDIETQTIRMRQTYSVGVAIERDTRLGAGYRIITAYPRNDDSKQLR